jgi:hypothetical protein
LPTADKFLSTKISLSGETNGAELKSFILTCEFEDEADEITIASVLIDIEGTSLTLNKYFGEQV